MKTFMNKAQTKAMTVVYSTRTKAQGTLAKAKAALSDKSGQGALDTAVFCVPC